MLVTATPLFTVFGSRIILEEKILLDTFGDDNEEYMSCTWRLLPYIY